MVVGGGLAAAFGLFAGYLSFRYGLRGPYFSLVTLAFAEMLRVIAVNWKAVGSSLGLVVPNRGSAPALFLFAEQAALLLRDPRDGARRARDHAGAIERSRMGYALAAIRENEDAAEAAGVDALATKLSAMAISSFLTALGRDVLRAVLRLHRPEPHLRARDLHRRPAARHRGRGGHGGGPAARLLRAHPDLRADARASCAAAPAPTSCSTG